MAKREWSPVTKINPCPACGKSDWCAWTREGWLKCERTADAPPGMVRVSVKNGGGVFKLTDEPSRRNGYVTKTQRRGVGDETTPKHARQEGSVAVAGGTKDQRTFDSAREAVAELERGFRHPKAGHWTYLDPERKPVFLSVRFDLPPDPDKPGAKPSKTFRPVSLVDGRWIIGDPPGKLILYHLPDLLATPAGSRVYVCEGEKAADAARTVGLTATTSPHGSKSAAKADWSPVAGRHVVILVDHDGPGEKYGEDVARLCLAAAALSVRIVRLVELWAGMPKGGDIADFLEHRGGDVDPIRAEVEALTNKTDADTVTPGARTFLAFKPFPVGLLPRSMREYILQTAERMDAEPALIVLPTLSVVAGAIGNAVRVMVKRGWLESCCLWTGVVALPGSLKTQTQAAAAAPIHVAQRTADAEHSAATTEYQTAKAAREAASKLRNKPEVNAPIEPEPEEPKRRQYLTQDATQESLVGVLSNNPRGVTNLWDELGGFFGGFARYSKGGPNGGEPGAAFYKSAYTGTTHTENRKGSDGKGRYVRLECPLVSVAGGIQPEALKRILLRQYLDDGLASRFLWAWPPDQPGGWVDDDDGDDSAAMVYAGTYRRLLNIPLSVDPCTGELKPVLVGLQQGAQSIAKEWVEEVRERVRSASDPAIRAAWAKLKGGAFRIALVLHLTEWAERGERDFGAITPDTLRRAVRIAEWFGREAERVYGMLSESDGDGETRRLVEWIERGSKDREPGTTTVRDLTRGPREFRDADDPTAKAENALGELVAAGIAEWVPQPPGARGGRATRSVRLVSRLGDAGDGDETPVDTGNLEGSVAIAVVAMSPSADIGVGNHAVASSRRGGLDVVP
jgi:hypothetical protein